MLRGIRQIVTDISIFINKYLANGSGAQDRVFRKPGHIIIGRHVFFMNRFEEDAIYVKDKNGRTYRLADNIQNILQRFMIGGRRIKLLFKMGIEFKGRKNSV